MGILNVIKNILFGSKKDSDKNENLTTPIVGDKSDHLLEVNEDHKSESFNKVIEQDNTKTSIIDKIADSEFVKKSGEFAEKATDAILDTGEKFMDKTKEFAAGPGKEMLDKFGNASEAIGEKIISGGNVIKDKVTDIMDDIGDKMDETIDKAKDFSNKTEKKSDFAETEFNVKDSELNDKEDFFNKADKFSKGDYSNEAKVTVTQPEKTNKNTDSITKISGFDDKDNDGDTLIDDADIIEDDIEKTI
ncbi:MAG: hypothetical protein R2771_04490 [Saprospiraceae bacterium]